MSFFSTWKTVLSKAASAWSDDRCSTLGAAISYYTLFSLAPMLLIAFAAIGLLVGDPSKGRSGVLEQIRDAAGPKTASAIESVVENAAHAQGTTLTIVSVITLVLGASGVFVELQDALNLIWKATKQVSGGIWGFIRTRLLSIGAVITVIFLLLVSLIASAVIQAVSRYMTPASIPGGAWFWEGIHLLLNFAFITLLCALTFRLLPNTRIEWRDVWGGALVTAGLFLLGKFLLTIYIAHIGVESMFGAAGSVVVVLVWVYYSAQIFLFGAEVTHAYAKVAGSRKDKHEEDECPSDGQPQVLKKEERLSHSGKH